MVDFPDQRVDFVDFPVEFGISVPEWLADPKDNSSSVILGGGSGVDHGHPYVMSSFEYKMNDGMRKYKECPHVDSNLQMVSGDKSRQGRLSSSCERHCQGSSFTQTGGTGTCSLPIASPGWEEVQNFTKSRFIPVVRSNGASLDLYTMNKAGKFKYIRKFSPQGPSDPSMDPKAAKMNTIEKVQLEGGRGQQQMILSTVSRGGRVTFAETNAALESVTPLYEHQLELPPRTEATDMAVLTATLQSGGSALVCLGIAQLGYVGRNDATRGLFAPPLHAHLEGLPQASKDGPSGMVYKFVRRLHAIVKEREPAFLVAGYFQDPRIPKKQSPRKHFVFTALEKPSSDSCPITVLAALWLPASIINMSDIECLRPTKEQDPNYLGYCGDALICCSLKDKTAVYRMQFDNSIVPSERSMFQAGWPEVTDPTFPPTKVLYLERVNACLVVWSNYTTALIDLTKRRGSWKCRQMILLLLLVMGCVAAIAYQSEYDERMYWWMSAVQVYNIIQRLAKAKFKDLFDSLN